MGEYEPRDPTARSEWGKPPRKRDEGISIKHEETVAFAKLGAAYELAFEAYQRLHRVGRFDLSQQLRLDALADVKSQLGKELGEYI